MSKHYTIARARNLSDLQQSVDSLVSEGWVPTGGVGSEMSVGMPQFFQALVKDHILMELMVKAVEQGAGRTVP